jgi:hypothetical protein
MTAEQGGRGPLAEFLQYCAEERARLVDSDEVFDQELFDEAVDLAERKLKTILGEDPA